ncbi:MAG: SIS domain-containing protein [Patescibacteria group bacterium]
MNLNDKDAINKLDKSNVLESVLNIPNQIKQAYKETKDLQFTYTDINAVLVCGMGGSSLGAHFVGSLFKDEIKVPYIILNDYKLPKFVDNKTLVILSSNSGNTEETISCMKEALEKTDKIVAITTGGLIKEEVLKGSISGYVFEQTFNVALQPRLATSYTIIGIMAILKKLKLLDYDDKNIEDIIIFLENKNALYNISVEDHFNPAKEYAYRIFEKIPFIVGAEWSSGVSHIFSNQLNETSKNLATYFLIPELNHHLLEGLLHPSIVQSDSIFVFIRSSLYLKRNNLRLDITKEILDRKKIESMDITLSGLDKITQAFEMLQLSSFITFYLAVLYNQDPCPIDTVDFFKKKLS